MNNNSNQKQHENLSRFTSTNINNRPKAKVTNDPSQLRNNSIPMSTLRAKKNLVPQQTIPPADVEDSPYLTRHESFASSIYNNTRGSTLDLNDDNISNGIASAHSSLKIPSKQHKTNYRKNFDKNSLTHSVSQSTINLNKNNSEYYDNSKNDFTKQGKQKNYLESLSLILKFNNS